MAATCTRGASPPLGRVSHQRSGHETKCFPQLRHVIKAGSAADASGSPDKRRSEPKAIIIMQRASEAISFLSPFCGWSGCPMLSYLGRSRLADRYRQKTYTGRAARSG